MIRTTLTLVTTVALALGQFSLYADEPLNDAKADAAAVDRDPADEIVRERAIDPAIKPGSPVELLIASYNVQARPLLDDAKEKFQLISPLLSKYDLVLIQECFTNHNVLWSKADFPNKVYFGRLASKGKVANSGLSILTRLPLGDLETEHFRDAGEFQNRLASKGILLARLQASGIPLDVYDTHMEAGASPAAQRARLGQADQVIKFVSKHSPPDHAVILMGDFNMGPRRPGKRWKDYRPNHYSSEEDTKARTAAFEKMRVGLQLRDAADDCYGPVDDGIERLLYREGTRCKIEPLECEFDTRRFRRPDGSQLSDGSPLVARLRITPLTSKRSTK